MFRQWGTRRKRSIRRRKENLPEELIVEILLKLPVKVLLRFRSVSKLWRALISNPSFIKIHYDRAAANLQNDFMIVQRMDTVSFLHHDPFDSTVVRDSLRYGDRKLSISDENIRVVGCCNGLVCLRTREINNSEFLWNPATKQYRQLPSHGIYIEEFTPSNSIGFGFDPSTNDYKVIRTNISYKTHSIQAEVYSLNLDCWKEINDSLELLSDRMASVYCSGIVNGIPYWIARANLISFDLRRDVFRKIALPYEDGFVKKHIDKAIVDFRGTVAVAMCTSGEYWVSFWTMDDGWGGPWTKKFTVEPIPGMYWIMGSFRNDILVAEDKEGKMFLYDPKNKTIKNVHKADFLGCSNKVCNYTESLVPIRGSTPVQSMPKEDITEEIKKMRGIRLMFDMKKILERCQK